jgi:hypothetical protein
MNPPFKKSGDTIRELKTKRLKLAQNDGLHEWVRKHWKKVVGGVRIDDLKFGRTVTSLSAAQPCSLPSFNEKTGSR